MAYADFSLDSAEAQLGVKLVIADLFPPLTPVQVSNWLQETLARGKELSLLSEKARSEFIVGPILLAVRDLSNKTIAIYSGQRLDVDPKQGLVGECGFLISLGDPVPLVRAPIITLVEAKKQDIDLGLGQCVAQMVGAKTFNERAGRVGVPIYGCVTTGDDWQFMRLRGSVVEYERQRRFISNLGEILAVFQTILDEEGTEARKAG